MDKGVDLNPSKERRLCPRTRHDLTVLEKGNRKENGLDGI